MEIWKSTRPLKWWFCGSFCAVFIVFSLLSIVLIFTQTKLDNLANNGIFGDFCVVLCSFCELFDVFFSYFSIFCKFLPTNPANFAKKDEFNISFPQNATQKYNFDFVLCWIFPYCCLIRWYVKQSDHWARWCDCPTDQPSLAMVSVVANAVKGKKKTQGKQKILWWK